MTTSTLHQPTQSPGRVPPHSVEGEEQLLSACFLDGPDVVARCINAGIEPKTFYVPANRVVFACMLDAIANGKGVEMYIIAEELKATRQLDEIGGYAYLTRISSRIPTTAGAGFFIERVALLHALREIIRLCTGAVENCYGWTGEPMSELLAPIITRLNALSLGYASEKEQSWDEVIGEAEIELKSLCETGGLPAGAIIPFPWPRMNERFQPMQRGQLVICAGRPSVGKSSLSRPLLDHATKLGNKAYFVTLEVNPRKVPLQIAASLAGVGLREVAMAHVADQRAVIDALRSLKGRGITISSRDRTIARIEARARALHSRGELDIMFIDHGGCVEDIASAIGEKRDVIGMVTKRLKALATELNIVVVLLWQLNRDSAKNGNREPNMTDLKDSGSLEEDADKILLIHRPDEDGITRHPQQLTSDASECPRFFQNIIQAKGRDDGTTLLSFYFHRATATFHLADQRTQ
jgi:replicative DNA helicase